MARQKTQFESRDFSGGIITEATDLQFPNNASKDEVNIVINRDGSRQRRLGLDYEDSYQLNNVGLSFNSLDTAVFGASLWKSVNNNPNLNITLVQIRTQIWALDLAEPNPSSYVLNGGVAFDLNNLPDVAISGNEPISVAYILGLAVICSKELDKPLAISYHESDDSLTAANIDITVRDLWGIYDAYDINYRSPTLTPYHGYNLRNQGWLISKYGSGSAKGFRERLVGALESILIKDVHPDCYTTDGVAIDPDTILDERVKSKCVIVQETYGLDGNEFYPRGDKDITDPVEYGIWGQIISNTAVRWASNCDTPSRFTGENDDAESGPIQQEIGTTKAPKGNNVISAFERGASRLQYYTREEFSPRLDREIGRPQVVYTLHGRLFYAGIDSDIVEPDPFSPSYNGSIFFTQNIQSTSQLGQCYQDASPTSSNDSLLVSTDGGVISISDATGIVGLSSISSYLLVFAENGVWSVFTPGGGFKADDLSIKKITDVGVSGGRSIVSSGQGIFYFGEGGIYALTLAPSSPVEGEFVVTNISQNTIQNLYLNLPGVARATALGNFDPASTKVTWLYNDSEGYDGVTQRNKYNKELVLDSTTGAFTINSLTMGDSSSPYVASSIITLSHLGNTITQNVVHQGEQVQVNGEDVVVTTSFRSRGASRTKYLTIIPDEISQWSFTLSEYNNMDFKDWEIYDGVGVDAAGYIITGPNTFGETQRFKSVNYLTIHMRRTETGFEDVDGDLEAINPGGVLCQARWDFSDSSISGKFGTQFQAYRLKRPYFPTGSSSTFDYGWTTITTKSKIRGSGKAISLSFNTEPGKDFYILGWGMELLGNESL